MKNLYRITLPSLLLVTLFACGGGGSSDKDDDSAGSVNTNYPHLLSKPVITYSQNTFDTTKYDVTVSVEADGPAAIYAISLWIFSKFDEFNFTSLDLNYLGGTSWSVTTNPYLPLAPGDYYVDSIMLEDGDALSDVVVKSSWYMIFDSAEKNYTVDQRETDWSTVNINSIEVGTSNISVLNFTLPPI